MCIQRNIRYICPSPIRQLSTEVRGLIFAAACTSFQSSEYRTPLSIRLVCSKWRDITLSTPSLWMHIYVAPQSGGRDVYDHFLERCGNIPVSVKVDIPCRYRPLTSDENVPYEETESYHMELVSAVSQTCAQWKVVELCMNHKDINLLGSHIQGLESPLLESLTLENTGPADYDLANALFHEASSLTSFILLNNEDQLRLKSYRSALPWRQLREICVQSDVYNLRRPNNDFGNGKNRIRVLRPHLYQIKLPRNVTFNLRISLCSIPQFGLIHSIISSSRSLSPPSKASPNPYATSRHFVPVQWTNPFAALPKFIDRSTCALQTFTVIMRGQYEGSTFMLTQPTHWQTVSLMRSGS